MKKIMYVVLSAVITAGALSGCGANDENAIDPKKEQKSDYVVNIDDSFNSGVELDDTKKTLSPEESDFRNMIWGMSKEDVIYAQGTGYREPDENTLYYTRVREEGYPADAEYTFEDNKLVKGVFYITENKEDKPVTIADYDELSNSLAQRYGTPKLHDYAYVSADDETDDVNEQASLIKENKLQLRTAWALNGTELRVVMFCKNGNLCIGLQYKNALESN